MAEEESDEIKELKQVQNKAFHAGMSSLGALNPVSTNMPVETARNKAASLADKMQTRIESGTTMGQRIRKTFGDWGPFKAAKRLLANGARVSESPTRGPRNQHPM